MKVGIAIRELIGRRWGNRVTTGTGSVWRSPRGPNRTRATGSVSRDGLRPRIRLIEA